MHITITANYDNDRVLLDYEGTPEQIEARLREEFPDVLEDIPQGDWAGCVETVEDLQTVSVELTGHEEKDFPDPVFPDEVVEYDEPPPTDPWPREADHPEHSRTAVYDRRSPPLHEEFEDDSDELG